MTTDNMHQLKYIDKAGHPQDLVVMIPPQKIKVIRPEDDVEMIIEVCNIISIGKAKLDPKKS